MYTDITHSVDVLPFNDDSEGLQIANIFAPLLIEHDIKAKERMPNAVSPGGKELKNLWDIFYAGGKPAKRIFMKGEAGCGKTFFCLKLLDTWCQVKQSGIAHDVLQQCLAVFDLVLYLPLRHVKGNITSVKEMIGQTVSEQCLNLLVSGGRIHCLVILDGLDESPVTFRKLPSMHGIISYVLFCTTRPWKLTQFQLKYKPDDKVVQILGLLPGSEKEVIEKVLCKFYKLKKYTSEFKKKFERYSSLLKESSLETLVKIPMMLTACICVWYEEDDAHSEQLKGRQGHMSIDSPAVPTSMTHTLLSLVDSMIRRADQKCDLRSLLTQLCPLSGANIPNIMASFSYINDFLGTLLPLCKLAYNDLVSVETKLVFQKDQLERKIGRRLVEIALKVGLISQTKAPGRLHQQNVSVNFYHKSVQEFLAAVYLTCTDTDDIRSYCTSLDKVMNVANIIKFGIALDPSLSKHVMEMVNARPDIQQYRRTLDDEGRYRVKQLYHTQCQWYKELTNSRTVTGDTSPPPSLHVTDICLDWGSDIDKVKLAEELMCSNIGTIVSLALLYVDHPLHGVVQFLPQCPNLSALYITNMLNKEDYDLLVSVIPRLTQLTTVRYDGTQLTTLRYEGGAQHDADRAVVAAVMTLTRLEWIRLVNVSLGDDRVRVADMTQLRTVGLYGVHMSAGSWRRFVSDLLTLSQSVCVILEMTDIDRERVRKIRTSPSIKVTHDDGMNEYGRYVRLEFTTSPSRRCVVI